MLKYFSAVQANVSVVSGKNYNRAALLASEYKVLINGFNEFKDSINIADIIITATASPHILISDTDLVYIKKPLLIFDLSVPRNVEKRTNNELVHLYNVDDLRQTSEYNLSERVKYIPVVEKIIENEINKLLQKN